MSKSCQSRRPAEYSSAARTRSVSSTTVATANECSNRSGAQVSSSGAVRRKDAIQSSQRRATASTAGPSVPTSISVGSAGSAAPPPNASRRARPSGTRRATSSMEPAARWIELGGRCRGSRGEGVDERLAMADRGRLTRACAGSGPRSPRPVVVNWRCSAARLRRPPRAVRRHRRTAGCVSPIHRPRRRPSSDRAVRCSPERRHRPGCRHRGRAVRRAATAEPATTVGRGPGRRG